ncbi:MAG: dTDP-4-dehydrorhamnose 3,5-epimerase [Treponema sp.]|nr:dTDP-4-dehydrorhamnose 3,5-epimerase [Treponema sp.]
MPLTVTPCTIDGIIFPGLYEIQTDIHTDTRGYVCETYSEYDFVQNRLDKKFVQDNESFSVNGTLRGLHFQTRYPQAKLIRAVFGTVFDVAVDLRNASPTFGRWYGTLLDGERKNQLYIPAGCAHGFYVLTDTAVCAYKYTAPYDAHGESGLPWNDTELAIDWHCGAGNPPPILSEKDMQHPPFDKMKKYFSLAGEWRGRKS